MVQRDPGPFEYYHDLHAGVTGDSIRADAHDPGLKAATIGALAGELEGDARQVAGELSGDITAAVQVNPQQASATAKDLAAKGNYAVGLICSFATMVDTFDTAVNHCNWRYRTELAMALRWAGPAAASTPDKSDDAQATEAVLGPQTKANIQPEYHAAVGKLDDDADSIAVKFKQGPTDANVRDLIDAGLIPLTAAAFYPTLTLTSDDKSQYYKNALKAMTPQEQQAWIEANKGHLDPEAAPYVDPSVQEYFAREVATAIKAPGKLSPENVDLMAFLAKQPAFAHELYSNVSPKEISDEIAEFEKDAYPGGRTAGSNDDDKAAAYRNFLTAAGTTLATYTKGTDQYAPPADAAKTWLKAITDDGDDGQGARLTLLLRAGGQTESYEPHFISDLAGGALEWEKNHDGPAWRPLDEDQGNGTIDPFRTGDSYGYASDGMANLLASMEHSPAGAQDFFLGRYDGATGSPHDRMEYLIHDRTFAPDRYSDDGDGLGKALQGAIVGEDTRTVDGTAIANDMFKTIAEHSGEDSGADTWLGGWGGANKTWHTWDGMTDSLGMIASGYSGDVYDNLDNNPGAHAGDPLHLQLDTNQMKTILGEIGHSDNKSGIETLTAAMVMEGNHRTGDWLEEWKQDHPGIPNPTVADLKPDLADMMGVGSHNGQILRSLLDNSVTIGKEGEAADATRSEYLSKAFDLAGGFVPGGGTVLGEGASELSKMTFDTVKGEGLELLKNAAAGSPAATSDDYTKVQGAALPDKLQYGAISQLRQHGFLSDAPAGIFIGDPPEVRPDLYDANDGASHIDPKLGGNESDVLKAWSTWQGSDSRLTSDGLTVQVKNSFFNGAGLPS